MSRALKFPNFLFSVLHYISEIGFLVYFRTMNRTGELFSIFQRIFSVYGIDKGEKLLKNLGKLVTFVISVPIYSIFLMIVTSHLTSNDDKLQVIQIIPYYICITMKASWFFTNFKKIMKFVAKVEEKTSKCGKFSIRSHKEGLLILKIGFFFNFLPPLILQIISLLIQKNFIPVWTPEIFEGHENLVFLFYWLVMTFCGFYGSLLVLSMDLLMLYQMIRIKGFSQFLITRRVKFQSKSERSLDESNLKFMASAHDLRK